MTVPFHKRRVYRSLVRPYQPLTDADAYNGDPNIYRRKLPGTERPRDNHYIYSVTLLEIDPQACEVPLEEKSSIHAAVTTVEERPAIFIYVLLDRTAFSSSDPLQLTERLLCAAHELLYAVQYPAIARNHGGHVTDSILRDNVVLVNPDEERDVVCSFITVARFLCLVAVETGIHVTTEDDLAIFQGTEKGQEFFRDFWQHKRCIAEEMAYDRIREFIETGLVHPEEALMACRAECASNHQGVCPNPGGPLPSCVGCRHLGDFTWRFQQLKQENVSLDEELVTFLCEHADC